MSFDIIFIAKLCGQCGGPSWASGHCTLTVFAFWQIYVLPGLFQIVVLILLLSPARGYSFHKETFSIVRHFFNVPSNLMQPLYCIANTKRMDMIFKFHESITLLLFL